jgi:hypothetical protein
MRCSPWRCTRCSRRTWRCRLSRGPARRGSTRAIHCGGSPSLGRRRTTVPRSRSSCAIGSAGPKFSSSGSAAPSAAAQRPPHQSTRRLVPSASYTNPLASGPHTHRHAHTPHRPAKRTLARPCARAHAECSVHTPSGAVTPTRPPTLRRVLYGHYGDAQPVAIGNAAFAGNIARCSRALYGCALVDAAPRAGRHSVPLLRPARPARQADAPAGSAELARHETASVGISDNSTRRNAVPLKRNRSCGPTRTHALSAGLGPPMRARVVRCVKASQRRRSPIDPHPIQRSAAPWPRTARRLRRRASAAR